MTFLFNFTAKMKAGRPDGLSRCEAYQLAATYIWQIGVQWGRNRCGADVKVISEVSGLSSKPKRDQRSHLPELCNVGWTAAEWVGILLTCCWTCWGRPGRLIRLEEAHSSGSISQTLARPQPHVHTSPFWGRPGRKNKSALQLAIPRVHFRGWSAFFSPLSHHKHGLGNYF